jgi:excisionase family DNA binding protein
MSRSLEIESINFTIVEAAEHLRVSRSYLYKLINSGALKPSKLGSRVIIPGSELVRVIAEAKVA